MNRSTNDESPGTTPDIGELAARLERNPNFPDPVHLSAALVAENISFGTFAIILAIHRNGGPMPIARIARTTGLSYFAARSQILNNIFFVFHRPSKPSLLINALASASLNSEADRKLQRIEKRLALT